MVTRNDLSLAWVEARVNITREGCWEWALVRDPEGYGVYALEEYGVIMERHVNRWVYLFTHGTMPAKSAVKAACGHNACVNPHHLVQDRKTKASESVQLNRVLTPRRLLNGTDNPAAKLKPYQVLDIRSSTDSHASTARRYGVGVTTVKDIRSGRNWGWLKGEKTDE